ncbi:hypothetical protein B7P43_G03021 [Cryptotermes secundus]|uniref:Vitamin K-dependent gamma-carboxylase n=1 Tax=Cryptotermes secundus TaxID=105785 RepID=A0A2J7PWE2_9NEOP|nr:hypothetical protein B7P43_G03021 [Cryptotermes secundus]
MDRDWLDGYSMQNLSNHWIFDPFKVLLTSEQVDFWIIHLNGFALDFSIGFFLIYNRTRPYALCVLCLFHITNSRLFTIGMFPYVCLATMPIFCDANWPRKVLKIFSASKSAVKDNDQDKKCTTSLLPAEANRAKQKVKKLKGAPTYTLKIGWKHKVVGFLLISHIGLQAFLPYSHFITKGYNNWTNGLYGYSWDMMVHTWDTVMAVVKVVDHETGQEHFLDPEQRMFDPRVDLLTADWSPIKEVSWLMPLLTEFSSWRKQITKLEKEIYSWSEYSDVIFVADFPGNLQGIQIILYLIFIFLSVFHKGKVIPWHN